MKLIFGLLFVSLLFTTSCGTRGGSGNGGGEGRSFGLVVEVLSGDGQWTHANKPFKQEIVARLLSPAGDPVPAIPVEFRETTSTGTTIHSPNYTTTRDGIFKTALTAGPVYDEEIVIEAAVAGTTDAIKFNLSTRVHVEKVEWVVGFEPPTNHTAHHLTPMPTFKALIKDENDELIALSNPKHWIELTVETGTGELLGTVKKYFDKGIATFDDIRYIRAENIVLRATHVRLDVKGKYVEQPITIDPGAATQSIVVLPSQTFAPGQMALTDAVSGTASVGSADDTFIASAKAVDNYYNLDPTYTGSVTLATIGDPTDTEPAPLNLISGERDFTIAPVTAGGGQVIRPSSDLATDNDSSAYTVQPGAPAYSLAILPGETFSAGQTSLASARTGSPTTQTAGVPFNVNVFATDAEYNVVNTSATASLTTSDGADTDPAPQALVNGSRTFSTTNITAGTTHTQTASVASYAPVVSSTYTVKHNSASQLAYSVQPTDPTQAGDEIAPTITIQDAYGNTVNSGADATASVSMSLTSGTGTLFGTTSMASVAGVADFTGQGMYIDKAGTGKVLTATKADTSGSGGTAAITNTSNSFEITPAPPDHFVVEGSTNLIAGDCYTYTVYTRDPYENNSSVSSNTTVDLTGKSNGVFYSDACVTPLGSDQITVTAGTYSKVFYYRNTLVESTTLQADDGAGGLAAGTIAISVTNAPFHHLGVSGISDPTTAGANETVTVIAQDEFDNTVPDYTGTIAFSSDDASAILPGNYTFLLADNGSHAFTNQVSFRTTGTYYLRATDTVDGNTGQQSNIDVLPGALAEFTVAGISDPTTAGDAETATVTAYDAYSNIKTDYTGTIVFSSNDGSADLPAPYTFVGGDNGVKTFTNGITLKTTGVRYVKVEDSADNTKVGQQSNIDVDPGAIDNFSVSGISDPTQAGAPETVTVTAYDAYSNIKTDYTGTITFSSNDAAATLPANFTFSGSDLGSVTFIGGVVLETTGTYYVAVADTSDGTKNGQQSNIDVDPGPLDTFTVSGINDPTTAGSAENVTVTAYDAYSNIKTDYLGTIAFSSTDSAASVPSNYTFVGGDSGAHTFTGEITLKTTGTYVVAVADTSDGTKTGQQSNIDVLPGPLDHFNVVGVRDPTTAGFSESVTVTAQDAFNNTKTDYLGTITFGSSDGSATLPSNYTFIGGDNGVRAFSSAVTLVTTGSHNVNVSDTSDGSKNGQQINIDVHPGAIDHFTVSGISDPTTAGDSESPTVTAYDQYNNVKTDYVGTIAFSSNDAAASLPSNYTFVGGDSGAHVFTNGVTLKTTGTYYVRATDTADGTKTGQQSNIDVNPAAIDHFGVAGISDPTTAGDTESVTVTAYDVFNNIKTDYTGTISFSSDDGSASLPADYTFVGGDNGAKAFSNAVTMKTAGDRYVKVEDIADGSKIGQQSAITVMPGPLDHLLVSGISDPTTAGALETVTVTAVDQFNNTVTTYLGTITFLSDDGTVTMPADYTFAGGDAGTKTFTNGVQFTTTGTYYVRAEDVGDGTKNGSQTSIDVLPAALDHFSVSGINDPTTAGTAESVTVTAYDVHNNIKTNYTGTVSFSSDDSAASLPAPYTFVGGDSGAKTIGGITFKTTGTFYLRVTDGGINDQQSTIDVHPGSLDHFNVSGINDPTNAGVGETVKVTAYDTFNNVKTDYTGTVSFTSDDGSASLPDPYTFIGGDSGTKTISGITFKTTGTFYVRATDGAVNNEQAGIDVNPAALDHFTVAGISDPTTAGVGESVTVTAYDTFNNVKTDYSGTVTFSSDDAAASLPSPYTFIGADNGVKALSGITFKTTGSFYFRAIDGSISDEQANIDVAPAALDHFTVAGISDPTTAGVAESVTVTAYDSFNNIKTNYTGTVTFSSDDGAASLPAPYTFVGGDNGAKTLGSITFKTTGSYYFRATDGAVNDQQSGIDIHPAALDHFSVSGVGDPTTAGKAESVTVTAYDAFNNTKTDYTGTITFSSDDAAAVLPDPYTFIGGDSGTKTFSNAITFKTTGSYYLRATDGAVNNQQSGIDVDPAALDHFTVAGINDPTTAGASESVTVTAYDSFNNIKTDYLGTVTFSSDDTAATLPAPYTFIGADSGAKTLGSITFKTTGTFYFKATDGSVNNQQSAIDVHPAALDHFNVSGISDPTTAGVGESVTVTAYDSFNNIKTNYTGTVSFSSDDGTADLPDPYTFVGGDSGSKSLSGITFKTTGSFYFRATDGSVNNQQSAIDVHPAALDHFNVSGINDPTTAGAAETVTVTAYDEFNNIKTDYTGTVSFTSDDASAVLPDPYTFVGGDTGSRTLGNITFRTTGIFYFRATDGGVNNQQSAIDVNPAALDHFTVAGVRDPTTAGVAESVTVTAYDSFNNIKTDYLGTIAFSSDDGAAVLPDPYTFIGGDSGAKTFAAITFKTAGDVYLRITDGGVNNEQANITIIPDVIDSFDLTNVNDPTTAGAQHSPTVTARDQFGNVASGYVGTISFSSDDGSATLPDDYTFAGGDAGIKTFTNGLVFGTTGTFYVRVEDANVGALFDQFSNVDVSAASLDHFDVTGISDPSTAGVAESVTVTAKDQFNNTITSYDGTISFSTSDAAGTVPGTYTFVGGDNGSKTFTNGIVFETVGTFFVKAEDVSDGTKAGQQSNIDVSPGAIDSFTVTGVRDPTTTGVGESVTVTAYDAFSNVKTDYTGTINFSSDDGSASLPDPYTFVGGDSGTKTLGGITFKTTGSFYLQVADSGDGTKNGAQSAIDVHPGALDHFTVAGINDPTNAGSTESVTVTAYDVFNNVKTDYTGTITFSSNDAAATLPADYTFIGADSGAKTFASGVILETTGDFYVKAEDVADGTKAGQQSNITVNPATLNYFTVSGISDPTTAGTAESVSITAYDVYDNVKTDYTGTVSFTSDDGAASLPDPYTFIGADSGAKTIGNITFKTTGSFYFRVSDGGISDEQTAIDVHPSSLDHFTVAGIRDPTTAGVNESVTVTAYDVFNNVKTDYSGTVSFSSDDGSAVLPDPYTFIGADNGAKTLSGITFKTTGSFYVRATDGGINNQQSAIDVSPSALDHFSVSGINDPTTAGVSESANITAYDVFNNVKTDYVGTISFSSNDASASLPDPYTFIGADSGAKTISNITFKTAGSFYFRVTDGAVNDEQSAIDVSPAALDHFTVAGINDPTTAGVDESVTVTAYDVFNNVKTDYIGTVTFTSDDGAASLPDPYTFVGGDSGAKTLGGITFETTGSFYFRATDGGVNNQQSAIDVHPSALDHFTVAGINDPTTAGLDESVTVTAYDAFNNIKTDYTGTVTFTSDDAAASLPDPYTFVGGDSGAKTLNGITFKTTGSFYVRATDGGINNQQSAIDVYPAALDHFTVAGIRDPTTAGVSESVTVTAYDSFNNVKTDYTGTVTFTSNDAAASLPDPYTFVGGDSGAKTLGSITFKTTGSFYLRATDGGVNNQQSAIDVHPSALDHFSVAGINDPTTTGVSESVTVTAYDAFNNIKTDYTGTVTFTSDDAAASLPDPYTFVGGDSGARTLSGITFKTTGSFYFRTTDGAVNNQQSAIDVHPSALDHFTVAGISDPTTAGVSESVTVTAYDVFNNVKTDYTGTVTFTSDDASATLPDPYTFIGADNGAKTLGNITFKTAGSFYFRATDGSVNNQQSAIDVAPAALDHFTVAGINDPTTTGVAESVTITAYDTFNNIKTDYTGTVTFSSDDAAATLPDPYTFVGGDTGAKTLGNITFKTTGVFYFRATDGGVNNQQSAIDVHPSALDHFTVAGINDPTTAGVSESVTVTAYDAFNNVKTDYTGTVSFSSDDAAATLPAPYTFVGGDSGAKTLGSITFKTTGSFYFRATDGGVNNQQSAIDVYPSALDHFTVAGIGDPTTAGVAESVTVTAYDAFNNVKIDYTGTVSFSSDDAAAVLPDPYTFVGGDSGAKTLGSITFKTTGSFYFRATDGGVNNQQSAIDVHPSALDHFTVAGINDPTTAGVSESVTITAYDAFNNIKTDYTGTVTFSSDDAAATLPDPYTFVGGDNGAKTLGNITFETTGSFYFRATDGAVNNQQSAIDVNPAALDHFTVAGINDPTTAGVAESVTVTAYDAFNNVKTDYTGTVSFSSDDASATLPDPYTFIGGDSGAKTLGNITFKTAGSFYLRATDGSVNNQQSGIDVAPAALDHFTVAGISDPTTAGVAESVTITAYDTFNNVKADYTGTVSFSTDDGAAVIPDPYTFVGGDNGAKTLGNITFKTTGSFYFRATDGGISDEQAAIDVHPSAIDHFTVTGISDPTTAGVSESVTVTAYDVFNNIKTDYTGTITFTSDDGAATLPAPYTFIGGDSGSKSFASGVIFETAGEKYVKVEDNADGTKSGQQSNITIAPAALDYFTVAGINDPTTAGNGETVSVTAYDTYDNVKTDYTGTISFSSDDGAAVIPDPYTFVGGDSGAKSFTNGVTFKTAGTFYIKAEDTSDGTKFGQQSNIDVSPAALDRFTVTGISDPTTAGVAESVTVTAYDTLNNIKTDYTGTIIFSSDDGSAVLPPAYTFVGGDNGAKTFSNAVTLKTAGDKYVKVEDAGDGTITGQQSSITVIPSALDHFTVAGINDPTTAGVDESVTVTAYDEFNNVKTNYTGTVSFSSDDAAATVPDPYTFVGGDSGAKTLSGITFETTGSFYFRATDGGVNNQQSAIDVAPAALDHFTVAGINDPTTAGVDESITVTAYDVFNNVKTDYTGTVTFSSDDAAAVVPDPYTFVGGDSGAKTLSGITFKTTGSFYFRATDGGVNNQQSAIDIHPAALDHFTVAGINDPTTAGVDESVTVTAYDAFNNVKTNYTGTVSFSSDDAAATLPNPYTFVGGDSGAKTLSGITFETTGSFYFRATDGGVNNQQSAIDVSPAALDHFTVAGINDPTTAGVDESVTVTAYDAFNNVKTNYTGTVTFSTDDGAAVVPDPYTFVGGDSGAKTLSGITLKTTGSFYFRATDGGVNNQQSAIDVKPAALDHFTVAGINDPTTAGVSESVTVTAYDAFNNVKTDYTGTVTFSSDDAAATLPDPYTFVGGDSGAKTLSGITFKTTGSFYFRATDGGVNNQQSAIDVKPAALDHFTVAGINDPTTAGVAESVTVTAYDAFNNIKTDYTGTVSFSSDDAAATLPDPYTFVGGDSGAKTLGAITFKTSGSFYVRATDGGVNNQQSAIDVAPAALDHFTVAGINDPTTAGNSESVTITAYDTFNNVKADYTGTVSFTSDDAAATLPDPYTFVGGDNGAKTLSGITFETTGSFYFRATDGAVNNQQSGIDVSPAALDHFSVAGINDPTTAGVAESVTITAYDAFNNVKTDYTGTVSFTSDDAAATLPDPYTFVGGDNGAKTLGGVTFETTGSFYFRATDGGVNNQQSAIDVSPAALDHFTVAGINDPTTAGVSESVTITAYDSFNNVKTDYTGTVSFTSDDAAATLPDPYTFVGGDNGAKTLGGITFETTGSFYFRATDGGVNNQQSAIDVKPAALDHFTVAGINDPTTAGVSESVTVTAYDAFNNVKTDYTGTVSFTSDDAAATLPDPYTFVGGDSGAKTLGGITFETTGSFYFRATDGGVNNQQSAIDVSPAALDHFTVAGINDPTTAGVAESVTVTAYDAFNNVKTDYTGTVSFTSDDAAAILPDPYTFVGGDNGAKTLSGITFKTAGSFYVRATDGGVNNQQSAIDVSPAALDHFTVAGINDPTTAGASESVTITAYDTFNNVKTDYTGTVSFTSDDAAATLPDPYTFVGGDSGAKTLGNITFETTGAFYFRATDGSVNNQQSAIDVSPAALDHFTVAGINDPTTAGVAESVTVTAYDAFNNVKTDYTGTVTFTSDDAAATLPDPYTFVGGDSGAKTLGSITFETTGSFYFRATDGGVNNQQSAIDVSPAALDHFTVAGINDPTTAGVSESVTVTAYDAFNNVKTDYTGTVTFTSDDAAATVPDPYTFVGGDNGAKTLGNITFETTGSFYFRASDGGVNNQQSAIDVSPAALDHFTVAGINDPTTAGVSESVTVTAYDAFNNIKTDYTGTVTFTSDDAAATVPDPYTFVGGDNGAKTLGNITFETTGSFYFRATDGGVNNQQSAIDVSPAALDHFTVAGINDPTTAGVSESVTVTAYDAFNNIKTDYTGTVTFTSDDAAATVPDPYTFVGGDNGAKTLGNITFETTGSFYFRATDGGVNNQQSAIDVSPAALDHFTVAGINDPTTAGIAESVTITAYDVFNNVKTDYTGTVSFTSDDAAATLPDPYTFVGGDSGAKTLGSITFKTTGSFYFRATDGAVNNQQSAIDVNPAALDRFTVTGISDPTTAGVTESVTVKAYDAFNNVKTDYTGTITFSSDDASAVLPADYTYAGGDSGSKTFTSGVVLKSTGSFYVKAEDTSDATKVGQQSDIDVSPAALDHFTVAGITDPTTAGVAESVTVTAYDSFNNVKTDYTGTVSFSSDDAAATVPDPYTFVGGDSGAKTLGNITFETTGSFYFRATDGGVNNQQSAIDIHPSALDHFTVAGINDPTTAGASESVTVTAYDAFNNVKTDYAGTVSFSTDDAAATVPDPYTFVGGDSGAKTLGNITFETTGSFYFRATDGGVNNQQSAIDVKPAALDHFTVAGINDPTITGASETATVTAYDSFNNVKTDYTGTVTFSSDDAAASLPDPYTFVGGDSGAKAIGGITFKTTGTFYFRATDGGVNNQQSSIDVGPGALDHFSVSGVGDPTTAGSAESVSVTAYDAFNNVKDNYTGTVTFSSDDAAASLPAPYTFIGGDNGTKTLGGVTFKTTGTFYIRATDGGVSNQQSNIDVNPAALDHLTVTGISDPTTAGQSENVTVTAYDVYNNVKTDYAGTISFSSDDAAAVLPDDYTFSGGDNGAKTFTSGVILKTTGSYYVQADDSGAGINAKQSAIDVYPGAVDSLSVSGVNNPIVKIEPGNVTVEAQDAYSNTVTGYLGTITFSSDDVGASLPGDYTFIAGDSGSKTFTGAVSFSTLGTFYVKAEDLNDATVSGQQSNIEVIPACLPDHLHLYALDGTSSPTTTVAAGTKFNVRVQAHKSDHSVDSCYAGTKTISFTNNGSTSATLYCGEPDGAPVKPSETSMTFSNGVANTTSNVATFKVKETTTLSASIAADSLTGSSDNITVNAGTACNMIVRDGASGGGTDLTAATLSLDGSLTLYAAGYDRFGNYNADVVSTWTHSGGVYSSPQPGSSSDSASSAKVVGVKITNTGSVTATWGAINEVVSFVVNGGGNEQATWTTATTDSDGNSLLGSNSSNAVFYWNATEGTDTWRTAGTQSWYSEAFSATRGSRKEFPERAILVGNTGGLDVIDATNNYLWARFSSGAGNVIDSSYGVVRKIQALNGKIYVAMRDAGASTGALIIIDLANDSVYRTDATGAQGYVGSVTVDSRNAGTNSWTSNATYPALTSSVLYSLHARTIGAIDYILVGTANSAELIQDSSGTVSVYTDNDATATSNPIKGVHITSDGKLYFAQDTVGVHRSDHSTDPLPLAASFAVDRTYNQSAAPYLTSLSINDIVVSEGTSSAQAGSHTLLAGTAAGLTAIQEHSTTGSSVGHAHIVRDGVGSRDSSAFGGFGQLNGGSACFTASAGLTTPAAITIEMFIRPDITINATNNGYYLVDGGGSTNGAYQVYFNASGQLVVTAKKGTLTTLTGTQAVWNAGQWYHLSIRIGGGANNMQIYIDGALDAQTAGPGGYSPAATAPYIGCTAATSGFPGALDEIHVFGTDNAFSYNAGTPAVPAAEYATGDIIYHMNDDSNTTALDSSGNARNATLSGMGWFGHENITGGTDNVTAVDVYSDGTNATAQVATSGSSANWVEITNIETAASSAINDSAAVDAQDVMIYQIDSISNLDVILGLTSGGVMLDRR